MWQLKLMEDDALVSIIWMGLRFDDPGQGPRGQWFPAAAFLSCKEASRVLSKIFNELGPSTTTSMHVLTKVMGQKCKERDSDSIMTIVPLGAEERPTIHFVPQSTTTLPDIFQSAFAHPFKEMYPYFVSTGGYINKEASDIASSSSDDGGASNRALFYSGVEVAASLFGLEYPPSAPTNRELAATAATLRIPGVLQAFGMWPSPTSGASDAVPATAVNGLTSSPRGKFISPSPSAGEQPNAYDSDCILLVDSQDDIHATKAASGSNSSRGHIDSQGNDAAQIDQDHELAKKLQAEESESGGDSRGAEAVDQDHELAKKLQAEESKNGADLFELIKTLSDKAEAEAEAEAKAGQPPSKAVVTPPKKYIPRPRKKKSGASKHKAALEFDTDEVIEAGRSFRSLVDKFSSIQVPPSCINCEVAANFKTGLLCATSAILGRLADIRLKGLPRMKYCGLIYGAYVKYTRVLEAVVASEVQVALANYKTFTKDDDIRDLLHGAIRGRSSNTYGAVMALMKVGQIKAPK